MKFVFSLVFAIAAVFGGSFGETVEAVSDIYVFKAKINTPQVFDNTASFGYRKFQKQTLKGRLCVNYVDGKFAGFEFFDLTNRTFKTGGNRFGYLCYMDDEKSYPLFNVIGSNRKLDFRTGTVSFFLAAEPMYVSFADPDQDNSLYILCSGRASTAKKRGIRLMRSMRGTLAGKLGCGCTAFGHTSPTREFGMYGPLLDAVTDVAAVYGTWRARYKERIYRRIDVRKEDEDPEYEEADYE